MAVKVVKLWKLVLNSRRCKELSTEDTRHLSVASLGDFVAYLSRCLRGLHSETLKLLYV